MSLGGNGGWACGNDKARDRGDGQVFRLSKSKMKIRIKKRIKRKSRSKIRTCYFSR
jgi:hypothetical protein